MQQYYGGGADAEERVRRELQANRYDPKTDTLVWTDGQVRAFEEIHEHYGERVPQPQARAGRGSSRA